MAVVMMMKPLAVIVGFVVVTLFCAADVCIATPQTQDAEQVVETPEELEARNFSEDTAMMYLILNVTSSIPEFKEYEQRITRINYIREKWSMEEVLGTPTSQRETTSADMEAAFRDTAEIVRSDDFRKILTKNKDKVISAAIEQEPKKEDGIVRVVGYIESDSPPLQRICSDLMAEGTVNKLSGFLR